MLFTVFDRLFNKRLNFVRYDKRRSFYSAAQVKLITFIHISVRCLKLYLLRLMSLSFLEIQ